MTTSLHNVSVRRIPVGNLEFHVNVAGDPSSPAVLLLHGSGPGATGASNWKAIMAELADTFYCIAPDVIGFGDSSQPNPRPDGLGPFTQFRVDTLVGLLDAMDVDRFIPVGNSMGGMWALGIVRAVPDRVVKLVLMGAGGSPLPIGPALPSLINFYDDPSVDAMSALLTQFVHDPAFFDGKLEEIAAERLPRALRPEVEASHRATFNFSSPWDLSEDDLHAIDHETLIMHGREDRFVRFDSGVYFFDHIKNSRLFGIGNCGHWTQIEHHSKFIGAFRAFVSGTI